MEILVKYVNQETEYFSKNTKKADKILEIGEYKHINTPNKHLTAALMQAIQLIFNMEEAIIRS